MPRAVLPGLFAGLAAALAVGAVPAPAAGQDEPPAGPDPADPELREAGPVRLDTGQVARWEAFFTERARTSQAVSQQLLGNRTRSRADAWLASWRHARQAVEAPLDAPALEPRATLGTPELDTSLGLYEPLTAGSLDQYYGPAPTLGDPGPVGDHPPLDTDAVLASAFTTGCRLSDPACRGDILDERLGHVLDTAARTSPAMALFGKAFDARLDAEIDEVIDDRGGSGRYARWVDGHRVFLDAGNLTDELVTLGVPEVKDLSRCTDPDSELCDPEWLADQALADARSDSVADHLYDASSANRYLAAGIARDPELAAQDPAYDFAYTLSQVLTGATSPDALERFAEGTTPDQVADSFSLVTYLVSHASGCRPSASCSFWKDNADSVHAGWLVTG